MSYDYTFMNYVIAIPSYKRNTKLNNTTLKVLQSYKIDKESIFIFVANEEEYELYKNTLDDYYKEIIIGVKGMSNIRNFITDYFVEDTKIFFIDDDIEGFFEVYNDVDNDKKNNYLERLCDLDKFINEGFNTLKKEGCNLFGVYPIKNPFFMKPENYSTDLKYIIGFCYGVFNKKNLKVTIDHGEDYERSMLYYLADNKVVRFNNVTCQTKCYKKNSGGMNIGNERNHELIFNSINYLNSKYPELSKLKFSKKRGTAELKLKDNR